MRFTLAKFLFRFFTLISISVFFTGCKAVDYRENVYTVYSISGDSDKIKCNEILFQDGSDEYLSWWQWTSPSSQATFSLDACQSTGCGDSFLYVIFDENDEAKKKLITISSVVDIVRLDDVNDTDLCEVTTLELDDSTRGKYFFGINCVNATLNMTCTKAGSTVQDEVDAIVNPKNPEFAVTVMVVLGCFGAIILFFVRANAVALKEKKKQEAERQKHMPQKAEKVNSNSVAEKKEDTGKDVTGDASTELTTLAVAAPDKEEVKDADADEPNGSPEPDPDPERDAGPDADDDGSDEDTVMQIVEEIFQTVADDKDGLDIYQVCAMRRMDPASQLYSPVHEKIPWCLMLNAYQRSLFAAMAVAVLQVFGISVVLWSVVGAYFFSEFDDSINDDAKCEWYVDEWKESWYYKFLAFLWALVITLAVGIVAHTLKDHGLNSCMAKQYMGHYKELSQLIDFGFLMFGMIAKYYTLMIAVMGSFFLIYASEGGEDALDMVLNAAALFFMFDLDSMVVSDKDYDVLERRIVQWRADYSARKQAGDQPHEVDVYADEGNRPCLGKRALRAFVVVGKSFRWAVKTSVGFSALFAPWVIMVCW